MTANTEIKQKNYPEIIARISNNLGDLRKDIPEVMKGFSQMASSASQDGELSAKTKEMIAMALSVAVRCDPCIGFHAKALVKLGGTKKELEEILGMAVYMGGALSLMYAADALAAFEQFGGK